MGISRFTSRSLVSISFLSHSRTIIVSSVMGQGA
jgi:hypothetical protein